jgi:hypothetical protein
LHILHFLLLPTLSASLRKVHAVHMICPLLLHASSAERSGAHPPRSVRDDGAARSQDRARTPGRGLCREGLRRSERLRRGGTLRRAYDLGALLRPHLAVLTCCVRVRACLCGRAGVRARRTLQRFATVDLLLEPIGDALAVSWQAARARAGGRKRIQRWGGCKITTGVPIQYPAARHKRSMALAYTHAQARARTHMPPLPS